LNAPMEFVRMNALNAGSAVLIERDPVGEIVTPVPAVTPCTSPGNTNC
jgi:hypothetical protein